MTKRRASGSILPWWRFVYSLPARSWTQCPPMVPMMVPRIGAK